jgi:hypothetical protein
MQRSIFYCVVHKHTTLVVHKPRTYAIINAITIIATTIPTQNNTFCLNVSSVTRAAGTTCIGCRVAGTTCIGCRVTKRFLHRGHVFPFDSFHLL